MTQPSWHIKRAITDGWYNCHQDPFQNLWSPSPSLQRCKSRPQTAAVAAQVTGPAESVDWIVRAYHDHWRDRLETQQPGTWAHSLTEACEGFYCNTFHVAPSNDSANVISLQIVSSWSMRIFMSPEAGPEAIQSKYLLTIHWGGHGCLLRPLLLFTDPITHHPSHQTQSCGMCLRD